MKYPVLISQRVICSLLLCVLGVSLSAQAQQQSSRFSAAEIGSLPNYCQDRLSRDPNRMKTWIGLFGKKKHSHLHHYCNGLIYFSRASMALNQKSRRFAIQRATSQFNYVLKRWPADFPLYQQAQMYKIQLEGMSR